MEHLVSSLFVLYRLMKPAKFLLEIGFHDGFRDEPQRLVFGLLSDYINCFHAAIATLLSAAYVFDLLISLTRLIASATLTE